MSPTESALRLSLAAPALRAELVAIESLLVEVLADPGLSSDLRAKLALRRESLAAQLRGSTCGHPLSYARLDGIWPLDFNPAGVACVTCTAPGCGSTFDVPVRGDVADRIRQHGVSGGPRGLFIVPKLSPKSAKSSDHSIGIVG